jgi:hypothetical protein
MTGPFRSAPAARADEERTGLDWFGPVRADRPVPVAAVLVSASLLVSIVLAALVAFDLLLGGALLGLVTRLWS